jgi:coatomer subunit beta'
MTARFSSGESPVLRDRPRCLTHAPHRLDASEAVCECRFLCFFCFFSFFFFCLTRRTHRNYQTKALVKQFEASALPVRCGGFIARKSWIIAGCDDMHLRVYNYNTLDKVAAFEAHQDYIRSIAVHPSQPFVVSSSDDMLIKLWDWEKNWQCTRVFEGHSHYVMQLCFNPKDPNVFASASLDRTIKGQLYFHSFSFVVPFVCFLLYDHQFSSFISVSSHHSHLFVCFCFIPSFPSSSRLLLSAVWSLGSPEANFTLEGHEKGVNCLAYYPGGDKPYLLSGGDDFVVKVWDYQNKKCIQSMEVITLIFDI